MSDSLETKGYQTILYEVFVLYLGIESFPVSSESSCRPYI